VMPVGLFPDNNKNEKNEKDIDGKGELAKSDCTSNVNLFTYRSRFILEGLPASSPYTRCGTTARMLTDSYSKRDKATWCTRVWIRKEGSRSQGLLNDSGQYSEDDNLIFWCKKQCRKRNCVAKYLLNVVDSECLNVHDHDGVPFNHAAPSVSGNHGLVTGHS